MTERWAIAVSIFTRSMAVLTSLTQVRSFGASPSIAVLAVRRKFDTETPGTSTGYCMARKRPARARSSTLIASTSWPSSVTLPDGDLVLRVAGDRVGQRRLARAVGPHDRVGLAVVDRQGDALEDLLGTVLGVDADVQVADLQSAHCLSLSSSCGVFVSQSLVSGLATSTSTSSPSTRTGYVGTGSVAGRAARLAGPQVEARAVQPALDLAVLDLALRERDRGVRALVVDGVEVVALTDDRDVDAVDGDGERRSRWSRPRRHRRAGRPSAQASTARGVPTFFSSSTSRVSSSLASTPGTPILRTMSAKKPCTTRRRASSSSMPRDCR